MSAPLPLTGLRVLDFGHTVMGPSCGVVLADLGAEVIRIEPPEGDRTRRLGGFGTGFFATYNRNKASLALDLKDPRGQAVLRRLLPTADVLVENFAPGTMERLGLGWEALRAINPRLVYCALKGYLPGPYEDLPALDEVVQMQGGLAHMTGLPGRPMRAGTSVVDIMGGVFGVVGILAALRQREQTGQGQKVQSALFESVAFMMGQHMAAGAMAGERVPPMTARRITWAIYDVFTAADGQVFVGVTSDQHWQRLATRLGLAELAADPALADNAGRVAARDRIMPRLTDIFSGMTVAGVLELGRAARIPCAPVAHPEDLFTDPHLLASGILGETRLRPGLAAPLPMTPLRFEDAPLTLRRQPPAVGEGAAEILAALGIGAGEQAELAAAGILALPDPEPAA
ncbi:CoA transferase [Roseomonas sp. GC11]|uniref:CaiB/BaiF CoA transferase family protein n=1 Tax=Roseomonas sp. GC11 TaxID=2950546 RepID=UPI00210D5FC5|nr:CoA transferase [Roseomonas sp. GC11]MCQ4161129.1 CoA transferase [Roseomonas sp. GC11]